MPFRNTVEIKQIEEKYQTKTGKTFPHTAVTYYDEKNNKDRITNIPKSVMEKVSYQPQVGSKAILVMEKQGNFWNVTDIQAVGSSESATTKVTKSTNVYFEEKDKKIHVMAALNTALTAISNKLYDTKKMSLEQVAQDVLGIHARLMKHYDFIIKNCDPEPYEVVEPEESKDV